MFERRTYLQPDRSATYARLGGQGVKDMDVWVVSTDRLLFIEVTSRGAVKKHYDGGESGGVARLAADLARRASHSLLVLGAGLAGAEPATTVIREHPAGLPALRPRFVFIVGIGGLHAADVMTLKDLIVRALRPALAIWGLSDHDVAVMTIAQAKERVDFPYLN